MLKHHKNTQTTSYLWKNCPVKYKSIEQEIYCYFLYFTQKSKKIFDPADHDQPSRKRKASDPLPGGSPSSYTSANSSLPNSSSPRSNQIPRQTGGQAASPSGRGAHFRKDNALVNSIRSGSPSLNSQIKSIAIKRENACMYCGLDTPKQKKGRIEHLLKCKDCVNIGNCQNSCFVLIKIELWMKKEDYLS